MKKNTFHRYAVAMTAIAGAAMMAGAALPALAFSTGLGAGVSAAATVNATTAAGGVGISAGANAALSVRIKNIVNRADEEITRRLNALNSLETRVNAMIRLSAADKGNLSAVIQSQIGAMNALQSQIGTDAQANNTSSLKADVQSIVKSYRIFVLVLPQGAIEAAADRVLSIANIMSDLSTKFSTRISAAQSAGNNVAAAQATLADFNARVSDASAQADAATSEVASLAPDNGNATIMASNTAALKDARSKIQAAQKDFVAAHADAMTLIKDLAGFKVSANAAAAASTSAQ